MGPASPSAWNRPTTTAIRRSRRMWPKAIDATTLPPRELKKTIRFRLRSSAPDFRKSTKAWGVDVSITPSATMTCGHRAPHRPTSRVRTRNVIELCAAEAGSGHDRQHTASARPKTSRAPSRRWWAVTGSNRRPSRCKRDALPTELTAPAALCAQITDSRAVRQARPAWTGRATSNRRAYEPRPRSGWAGAASRRTCRPEARATSCPTSC